MDNESKVELRELTDDELDHVSGGLLNNIIAFARVSHSIVNQLDRASQRNVVNISL